MTGKRWSGIAAALALGLAVPAGAQNSDAPVDVTAAPPPSAETVGPSQLRDFNLRGTVTRPADQPASSPSQPASVAPAQPRDGEAVPSEAAAQPAAGSRQAPRVTNAATRTAPSSAEPQLPTGQVITPSLPLDVVTDSAVDQAPDVPDLSTPISDSDAPWSWPWIAALLALLAGGFYLGWSKLGRRQRYADPGRMAFAGLVPDDAGVTAPPPRAPRPDPVPPRAQPAPRPDPVPHPAPRAADDGLIVSTALKPKLTLQFTPDRAVVTANEVLLQFDVLLSNSGTAPARDILVEAKLLTAHVGQDGEIAAFFKQPLGRGDRMAVIPPMGKVSLKSAVRLPLDQVHSFEVDSRRLFVPMVAFNILFRAGSGEEQTSASYLVGRGSEEDEKLAPFRIDLGPRVFRGLSARPHSLGLQPA